jgi:hypothetical protein
LEETLKKGALTPFNLNLSSIENENSKVTIFKRRKMMCRAMEHPPQTIMMFNI